LGDANQEVDGFLDLTGRRKNFPRKGVVTQTFASLRGGDAAPASKFQLQVPGKRRAPEPLKKEGGIHNLNLLVVQEKRGSIPEKESTKEKGPLHKAGRRFLKILGDEVNGVRMGRSSPQIYSGKEVWGEKSRYNQALKIQRKEVKEQSSNPLSGPPPPQKNSFQRKKLIISS